MDKTKTRDMTLRIFAVIVSFILWMYVTAEQNPEMQIEISDIPVKLVNTDALSQSGLIMVGDNNYTIRLTIKGRSKDVRQLKPQDFKAEANLGGGFRFKGLNSIPYEIKEVPKNIEIPKQPMYISVELDELVKKNFPINIQVEGGTQEGYANLPATVKPAEVILTGAAKYIGRVNSVVTKVRIKDSNADIQTSMPILVLDKDGNPIQEVECTPKTVDILVPIKKAKQIPITVKTTGKLPAGIFLMGTSVNPVNVNITGDERVVNALKSIDTAPVSLEGVTANTTKPVKLSLPPGVILLDNIQTVNVDISIETTISKTFSVLVNYTNLPGGLAAELLTNTISVTLTGQESVINKVIASDITAAVDLGNAPVEDGEYDYTPKLKFPPGLEIQNVNPNKIKVKITKKQG